MEKKKKKKKKKKNYKQAQTNEYTSKRPHIVVYLNAYQRY